MNLPLDDRIILALLALVLLVIIYERSRKPALLSNTHKLGKWVYLFSLAFAASWAIVALVIYMSGGPAIDVITLWIAAAIAWGGGWAYRQALRR
jgi:hypothetical protein